MKKSIKVLFLFSAVLFCYKTNAQDVNWDRIENLNVSYVKSIAINSNDDIFVATYDSLFRSTNNGNEWIKLNKPSFESFYNMFINQKGDIYGYRYTEIYRSKDNGESWTNIFEQNSGIYGVVMDSSGRIFVANCFNGVLCSTDDGGSWKQVLDSDVHGIVILPSQAVIAGCWARGKPAAFRSDDNGENWQECFHAFTSLCQNSTETLFAVAGSGGMYGLYGSQYIYRSVDAGESWDSVYNYNPSVAVDLVVDNNDQIFAVGAGGVVTSTDNGDSWFTLNAGLTSYNVSCIEKNSKDEILIGTQDGVYKCVKKTITQLFDEEQFLPNKFILSQNYPNPFNPTTTIGYVLQDRSNAKLTLLNTIGEEIAILVNEDQDKGYHNVEFNAANLPSGVYFYQLKSGRVCSDEEDDFIKVRREK